MLESKSKKKGKKNENFGFEDLDQAGPKNYGVPDRNANQTPFGDFGGRKVSIPEKCVCARYF